MDASLETPVIAAPVQPPPAAPDAADHAGAYGYCAAKSRWGWGLRLLLVSDRQGVFALAGAHPGSLLFADAGHRGCEHYESLKLVGVELIAPERHRLGERPPAETSKARIRLVIASGFATLKGQMRLEEHE